MDFISIVLLIKLNFSIATCWKVNLPNKNDLRDQLKQNKQVVLKSFSLNHSKNYLFIFSKFVEEKDYNNNIPK